MRSRGGPNQIQGLSLKENLFGAGRKISDVPNAHEASTSSNNSANVISRAKHRSSTQSQERRLLSGEHAMAGGEKAKDKKKKTSPTPISLVKSNLLNRVLQTLETEKP